ncbi:MAG: hypothetical protein KJ077_08440 [Anaerolineae bacterium]|nr:hypothetical protein [Anaerolineae bacterium]
MMLTLRLGDKEDLHWAQNVVTQYHYLHRKVDWRARPMVYVIMRHGSVRMGALMLGIPHATRCQEWWGPGTELTQWQVVDLCRVWLDPAVQFGGEYARPGYVPGFTDRRGVFRPTVASWAIEEIFKRVQRDRVSLWPPVYPEQPYHIRLVISYHDPQYHKGTIYRAMGWEPMYTNASRFGDLRPIPIRAVPGPSGKYGWCWRLPEPEWAWNEIPIAQPRTMRLVGV